ncbi:hypothetical protein [Rhizobium paknamense]|uniref:J domain-containing protein n=1 Tax=Rhizobium paknamense TaxID=1206817 RepID=A0ABU0I833_9HYPH|nr:hypothetical protein [Rhizobium paknamense]MDQ0454394.1 hypothetical protein [Rhizobium paknamense]
MLLKQSLFQSVVDRLDATQAKEEQAEDGASAFRIMGLSTGFVQETAEVEASLDTVRSLYEDVMEDAPTPAAAVEEEPETPPPMPDYLHRLSLMDIAEDLGLTDEDDAKTLLQKRRAFARLNHPDRVHAAYRDQANQRMMLANRLIDQALKRLHGTV